MHIASKIDEVGPIGWIALTVGAFLWFWPVGLAVVAFLAFSGRLHAYKAEARGRWHNKTGGGCGWRSRSAPPSSGNKAFDDYRSETLRRLEDEQKEFLEYLERLRQAKDKQEFDQFMADRRRSAPDQTPQDV